MADPFLARGRHRETRARGGRNMALPPGDCPVMLPADRGADLSRDAEVIAAPAARQGLGLVLIFLTTACFACITTFSKLAYADGSNPVTLMLLRFAGFAAFTALYNARGDAPSAWSPAWRGRSSAWPPSP